MKVFSFMRQGYELVPVEVELTLVPGLPQISFLGLPDTLIRESVLRIKSALRNQDFELPPGKQVLVHLKPTYLKKSSRGLDLAVAAALLWETGQLPSLEWSDKTPVIYGELSLTGRVTVPDDLEDFSEIPVGGQLLTGPLSAPFPIPVYSVGELRDLALPEYHPAADQPIQAERPALRALAFGERQAELLSAIACGEHHTLLAGPPGSGKTTVAEQIPSILNEPSFESFRTSRRIARHFGQQLKWRPVAQPHHSVTPLAMIGGGATLYPGEVTRAHGGVLIMDEVLEFHSQIQEALREPIECGRIYLARAGKSKAFPADTLLIATTNLCPCGDFVPKRENRCRCQAAKRRQYFSKLMGPFIDRFAILAFSDEWKSGGPLYTPKDILARVEKGTRFRKVIRKQKDVNSKLTLSDLEKELTSFQIENILPLDSVSHRRRQALLRVARTFADLEESVRIENRHLEKARHMTVAPFQTLRNWQD